MAAVSRFCPECGATRLQDQNFCVNCGEGLKPPPEMTGQAVPTDLPDDSPSRDAQGSAIPKAPVQEHATIAESDASVHTRLPSAKVGDIRPDEVADHNRIARPRDDHQQNHESTTTPRSSPASSPGPTQTSLPATSQSSLQARQRRSHVKDRGWAVWGMLCAAALVLATYLLERHYSPINDVCNTLLGNYLQQADRGTTLKCGIADFVVTLHLIAYLVGGVMFLGSLLLLIWPDSD